MIQYDPNYHVCPIMVNYGQVQPSITHYVKVWQIWSSKVNMAKMTQFELLWPSMSSYVQLSPIIANCVQVYQE